MSQEVQKKDWRKEILSLLAFVVGTVLAIYSWASERVPPGYKWPVRVFAAALTLVAVRVMLPEQTSALGRWAKVRLPSLGRPLPALTALVCVVILFLCLRIDQSVWRPEKPVPVAGDQAVSIPLDIEKGAIFNSWERQQSQQRYIEATGKDGEPTWGTEGPKIVYFYYEVNPKVLTYAPDASSGGYITFYAKPFDREHYNELRFELKVTDAEGQPDVGIRLAVDDPDAQDERERVTYELPSLKPYSVNQPAPNGAWQRYAVKLSEFKRTRFKPPLPDGISQNHINKLVFFVNVAIVKNCPKGKLWFRDVTVLP